MPHGSLHKTDFQGCVRENQRQETPIKNWMVNHEDWPIMSTLLDYLKPGLNAMDGEKCVHINRVM